MAGFNYDTWKTLYTFQPVGNKRQKNNRINLVNNLTKTNIVGGKLPREVCGKLQMISGQPSIRVHSEDNLATMSVSIICHVSC